MTPDSAAAFLGRRGAALTTEPGAPLSPASRVRALGWFFIAIIYTVLAAPAAARMVVPLNGHLSPTLVDSARAFLSLVLLLVGYSAMGFAGQGQRAPLRSMGLAARPGAAGEWALGAALGWAGVLACVLPVALFGQILLQLTSTPATWLTFVETTLFFAISAMGEEVAFRGYPFQRLVDATHRVTATLVASALFATAHLGNPGATAATFCSTFLAGLLFTSAYLRTRGLWLGWGLHFAWNASTALLFGLPLSGLTGYSPVLSAYTRGPVWLTGGGYGPEGSAIVIPVLLLLLIALNRATVELKHRWATPPIVAAGYPVDLEARGRAQHARAMGEQPRAAEPSLVQILPAPTARPPASTSDDPE